MKVIVTNRANVIDVVNGVSPQTYIVVTMTDPESDFATIPENEGCCEIHRIHAHDANKGVKYTPHHIMGAYKAPKKMVFFTVGMGKRILESIDEHNPDVVICQCDAGKSRSAGLAAALLKIYSGDDTQIYGNAFYKPNSTVYSAVLEAKYGSYGEFKDD